MKGAGHFAIALLLAGCMQSGAADTSASALLPASPAASKIRHVVIVFQENRSFDDLFNGFPGADTVKSGLNSQGNRVPLRPVGLSAPYDLSHEHAAFETEYAGGKLNGFDKEPSGCVGGILCPPKQVRAYGFVPHAETKPYFTMASEYTLADHMFQTNQGPSFPAHQYI
ncbi:MAG TPA: alkaline phosphatase family protein, partial [Candidatus Nitrosotalea sp.]|nr:alkaline phosphatase family protein [Candidatus Nitrosotalea sp.]